MTIEEKAKAYDEVRKKTAIRFGSNVADEIFSQFEISEDEKIRRDIISFIKNIDHIYLSVEDNIDRRSEWLAWLEKQGEQKPTNKVEHKFKVGDSIKTANEAPLTITKITDSGYWSEDLFICSFENSVKWELVEQKPVVRLNRSLELEI